MGQTITVCYPAGLFTENDGYHGFASYRKNEIQLRPSTEINPLSAEQQEQAFWHELTHFILYHGGAAYKGKEEFMHQDEGFVELVGSLLHQAVNSFEYGPEAGGNGNHGSSKKEARQETSAGQRGAI